MRVRALPLGEGIIESKMDKTTTSLDEELHVTEQDQALYRDAHDQHEDLTSEDPRLANLRALNAVVDEPLNGKPVPLDPTVAERRFIQDEVSEIYRRLARITQIGPTLDQLTPPETAALEGPGIRILADRLLANAAITQALETSPYVWTAQTVDRRPETLQRSIDRDRQMLGKGVAYRTIYQPSARTDPNQTGWAAAVSQLGAVVRTSAHPYPRMVITETAAFISDIRGGKHGRGEPAMEVTHPGAIAWIKMIYQYEWERADPWYGGTGTAHTDGDIVTDGRDRQILRALESGLDRRQICVRLSISERTYSGHLAKLREKVAKATKEKCDAVTDFQLAMWWARQDAERMLP